MTNDEKQNIEEGIAISRGYTQQQLHYTSAMVASAALAFFSTLAITTASSVLALAIAAAAGLSVGVWCQPNAYRRQNGSLTLALVLITAMWAVPVVVMLIWPSD